MSEGEELHLYGTAAHMGGEQSERGWKRPMGVPTESGGAEEERPVVERADKYSINVDLVNVFATPDQERRIRELDVEQLERLKKIFGG